MESWNHGQAENSIPPKTSFCGGGGGGGGGGINSNFETTARLPDHAGQRFVSVQNHVTVDKGQNNRSVSSSRYTVLGITHTRIALPYKPAFTAMR